MSVGAVNKQTGDRIPTAGMPAIDSVLSGSSTNPVQNAIITAALADKQDKTDNNLTTTDKTTTGAINELKSGLTNIRNRVEVAKSTSTGTYSQKINALVSAFESLPYDLQIRCFIETGGAIIRFKSPTTFMDVVKYDISGGKMTINTIMMGYSSYMNKIEITANGTVITDISATEDSSVFTLYYN